MAKTAERNFRQYSTIKTILAGFLDHPTSQTGADALRAFAWLSPQPLSLWPSSVPRVGSASVAVDEVHPL